MIETAVAGRAVPANGDWHGAPASEGGRDNELPPFINLQLRADAHHQPKMRCAASTSPNVKPAITTSPIAPTANGFNPCFDSALKLVRSPTPANVSKNAQRERFASAPIWSFEKNAAVASAEISRNPRTNLGNFCQRNSVLFPTACACPRLAQ